MTTLEADKLIHAQEPVRIRDRSTGQTFTALFVGRSRFSIYAEWVEIGGERQRTPSAAEQHVFDRRDLEILHSRRSR